MPAPTLCADVEAISVNVALDPSLFLLFFLLISLLYTLLPNRICTEKAEVGLTVLTHRRLNTACFESQLSSLHFSFTERAFRPTTIRSTFMVKREVAAPPANEMCGDFASCEELGASRRRLGESIRSNAFSEL